MLEQYKSLLKQYRRDFHRYPESGWMTYRTSMLVADALDQMGFSVFIGEEIISWDQAMDPPDPDLVAENRARCRGEVSAQVWEKWQERMGRLGGVIGIYDSGRPGKTLAYHFDMDALNLEESHKKGHLPQKENFVSRHAGCFHGCGHDGHTAVGLVTARFLMEDKGRIRGKLMMIFQPAEEGVRGAKSYCEHWKFGKIDRLLCGHIGFTGDNTFVAGTDGFLATTKTEVEFFGTSAHAGLCPERGRNALLAAASATVQLMELGKHMQEELDSCQEEGTQEHKIVRLNVGILKGGESRNTIPAYSVFEMETRGSDCELDQAVQTQAMEIIEACASECGVKVHMEEKGKSDSAASSEHFSRQILEIARQIGEFESYTLHQHFGASDDSAVFLNMVQKSGGEAAYLLFGSHLAGRHHEIDFDFDESVLGKICDVYIQIGYAIFSSSSSGKM